ncbi:MAG: LuxR C-terminal-related transcriptional regulator [Aeromicrobium sp.]|uniref:helix-turn-helix transcriptional regulator n=1 Tax=Aeromicrobium sp. TaxID=1871063 RepID=UPI003C534B83
MTWGQANDALDLLDDALATPGPVLEGGVYAGLLRAARADALLALGRATHALAVLDALGDRSVGQVPTARLRLLAGDPSHAHVLASRGLNSSLWRRDRTQLLLIDAAARTELGDDEGAARCLSEALGQIEENNDRRSLATIPRSVLQAQARSLPQLRVFTAELDDLGVEPTYPDSVDLVELSPREHVVLQSLSAGRTLAETAAGEFVSVDTVKSQTRSLYAKLKVHNRRDLILQAHRLGLADDQPR